MNIFIVQIALIFLPGLVWMGLDRKFAAKEKPNQFEAIIKTFLFGTTTYAVLYLLYQITGFEFSLAPLDSETKSEILEHDFLDEILLSIPLSFLLGVLWVAGETHKWLTRFLQSIHVTKRFGDEDVWDFVFNSSDAAVEYVHVRDFTKNLVYAGWVSAFSETGQIRELLLRDVQIYDANGECSEVPRLYIARDRNDIHIEFPYQEREPRNG